MTKSEAIKKQFHSWDDWKKVDFYNEFCGAMNWDDDYIYSFADPEEFIKNEYPDPYDAFVAGRNADMCWSDDWIKYDGYGNLVTRSNPENLMNLDDMFREIEANIETWKEYFDLDETESEDE